ncbi:MAG TPA: hypothetical protein DIV41_07065 [Ruminococcaceae bacterium]|jgi:hypothetical protein|nr:hypothetical protein [Oscillospiraceae bacterium]
MMGKKERTAAPFLWGLGPPNKQKREDAASGRSSVFREKYMLFHCLPRSQVPFCDLVTADKLFLLSEYCI